MSISRVLLITLLISSAIVLLALMNLDTGVQDPDIEEAATKEASTSKTQPGGVTTPAAQAPNPPPASGVFSDPTAEDLEVEREQIQEAMKMLSSPTETERVEAVEQLGAFPNPQTESTLTQILAGDSSADVRNAAALSLGSLEAPSPATISTLLGALKDQSEDVRYSSLSTLEDFLLSQEEDAPLYQSIRSGLESVAKSSGLPEELQESISEVLKGQTPPGAAEPTR